MGKFDQRVDVNLYIEHAADFAKPLLEYLRRLVHSTFPEITQTIKSLFKFYSTIIL